jgi:hypothetical protein
MNKIGIFKQVLKEAIDEDSFSKLTPAGVQYAIDEGNVAVIDFLDDDINGREIDDIYVAGEPQIQKLTDSGIDMFNAEMVADALAEKGVERVRFDGKIMPLQ